MRSVYPSMVGIKKYIKKQKILEIEKIMSIKEILELIPGTK